MASILAEDLEQQLFKDARAATAKAQAEFRYKTQIFPRHPGLTDEQWLNHVAAAVGCTPENARGLAQARDPTFLKRPAGTMLKWTSSSNESTYRSAIVMEKGLVIQVKSEVNGICDYHVDKCYCSACWLYLHDGQRRPFKTLIFDDEYKWRQTLDMEKGVITVVPPP